MHDPFLNYATMSAPYGAQPGIFNPIGIPYNLQTSGVNPLAAIQPLAAATLGLPQAYAPQTYATQPFVYPQQLHPQQLQLASALAQQALIPQILSQHTLGLSPLAGIPNPIVAAVLSNPYIAAALQSPYGGQMFPQQHTPYSQLGQSWLQPTLGAPLAPQTWIGPGGIGLQGGLQGGAQGYGQVNPLLAHLAARAFQGQGASPWGY
jgi:hypothetical protein